jgi:hypothetical protein
MIYTYTKQANLDLLETEIKASSITIALDSITLDGTNDLTITFKASLSTSEETTLDNLVTDHDHTLPAPTSAIPVEVQGPKDASGRPIISHSPFSDTGGFRFRGASFTDTVATGTTKDIDYEITAERWINGGRLIVDNIGDDDKITFQVVDKDNIFGYGAGVVLDEFIKEFYIPKDGDLQVNLAYPARLVQGLYLRLKYTSTHASGCNIKCNLYLHWKAA